MYLMKFHQIFRHFDDINKFGGIKVTRILVGNKCDLTEKREVSYQDGAKLASELGIQFLETSAKDNINVDEMFYAIA